MIRISKYFIPYILILFIAGLHRGFFISLFWVFIHELSHAITAKIMGVKKVEIRITPLGFSMHGEEFEEIGYIKEIVIILVGPIMNIIIALIFYFLYKNHSLDIFKISMKINLVLGIFNLLPAIPLDGSRILHIYLQNKYICKKSHRIKVIVSMITGFFVFACFIFLLIYGEVNISLGLLSLFIIYISYKEKRRIVYIIIGDIMKKKVRFLKNGYIENKSLSISSKLDLLETLSIIDKNKYHIFIVLDEDMKVIDTIYEQEIIEALKNYGNITLKQYISEREGEEI